jgi:hypothetical protein
MSPARWVLPVSRGPDTGTLREGDLVQVEKRAVTAALRRKGDHDRAQRAQCSLPRKVDTERDAGLLHALDVDLDELEPVDSGGSA